MAGATQSDRAGVTRAAVLRDPVITAGVSQFAVIQSVASSIGLDVRPVNLRDAGEEEERAKFNSQH
jgi:putative ABC transport system substrate-binding protein